MLLVSLVMKDISVTDLPVITYSVLLTRITCAVLLHMQLEGEIRQSMQMLNYASYMVYHQRYRRAMILISLMQFIGAIATEVISILLICNQDTV